MSRFFIVLIWSPYSSLTVRGVWFRPIEIVNGRCICHYGLLETTAVLNAYQPVRRFECVATLTTAELPTELLEINGCVDGTNAIRFIRVRRTPNDLLQNYVARKLLTNKKNHYFKIIAYFFGIGGLGQ